MRRWPTALGCVALALFCLISLHAEAPGTYRISGVVVSTRDGAPVPYCRLTASLGGASGELWPGASPQSPVRMGRPGPGAVFGASGAAPGFAGQSLNRQPRAGARAQVGEQGGRPETKTDATGHFTLDLPSAGAWQLSAEARGFRSQYYDDHEGYFSSVVLSETAPTYVLTFRLTPDSLIRGIVLDDAGDPVAHGQVIAELVPPMLPGQSRDALINRPRQVGVAQTDDLGRYELFDLQPGDYRVRVQAQPWYATGNRGITPRVNASPAIPLEPSLDVVFPVTWFPAAMVQSEGEIIALSGGEEREADFHLTALPASHLIVTRPDSPETNQPDGAAPRAGQAMTITRVSAEGAYGQTSFMGGSAREWDFGNLTPGTYELRLPGPHGDEDGEVRQVEVRPGGAVVSLEDSTPLTPVKVAIDAADGVTASVVFVDTQNGRRISSNRPPRMRAGRGRDDSPNPAEPNHEVTVLLPPHRYQVTAEGGGTAYVSSLTATGARAVGKTIEVGTTPASLTVRLQTGRAEVSGVARLNGKPASGALVLLVPATLGQPGDTSIIQRDQSNTDGSFRIRAVVPGQYILVAVDHGWSSNWRTIDGLAKYLAQGIPLQLQAGDKPRQELAAVLP